VAVRHALGQYSVMPTLDFEQETTFSAVQNFGLPFSLGSQEEFEQELSQNKKPGSGGHELAGGFEKTRSPIDSSNLKNWQKLFEGVEGELEAEMAQTGGEGAAGAITIESTWSSSIEMDDAVGSFSKNQKEPYQIHASYIVSHIKSGFLLIDQQAAHERILYERYLGSLENKEVYTQKQLFPKTLALPTADAATLGDILPQINLLGFDIQTFGKDTFIIHGVPSDLVGGKNEVKLIESLLQQYKENLDLNLDIRDNIARSMARSAATKRGQNLSVVEMQELIDQLFACEMPFKSPSGRSCFLTFDLEELEERFKG
jgi:DNA mismatch repair protein MutL